MHWHRRDTLLNNPCHHKNSMTHTSIVHPLFQSASFTRSCLYRCANSPTVRSNAPSLRYSSLPWTDCLNCCEASPGSSNVPGKVRTWHAGVTAYLTMQNVLCVMIV